MSRTDVLSEIKKAEAEADARVAKAESDKKVAIAEARRESVKRIQDAEADMRNTYESVIEKEQKALDKEREKQLAEGESASASLGKSASKKIKKAEDFLAEEFERAIDVTS